MSNLTAPKPTIAVTGATGFIGHALTRHLRRAGWPVRVLVRSPSRAAALSQMGVETIPGCLNDAVGMRQLVDNSYAVVHCAGAVRGTTRKQFTRTNVDGVNYVIDAAARQTTPPRLLCLSSLAAREPRLSAYAESKQLGEQQLLKYASELQWTAFRPPAVYGPGDRELLPLLRLMGQGLALIPGSEHARFSMLYIDDLARAVECWLNSQHVPQGIFTLHDGHPGGYSWNDLISTVEKLRHITIRRCRIPRAVLNLPAMLNWSAALLLGRAPMLTPGKVRELTYPDWVCDNGAIHHALDWHPRVQLNEGLSKTPGWTTRSNTFEKLWGR